MHKVLNNMSWMSSFAFQKISWWFACRGSRFLFSFHDMLYRRVSGEAVSDRATRNRLASMIICLSCRSVKNSFLDLLWIIAFFLFRIIFVRFRETFSLKVREWVQSPFNKFLHGLPGEAAPYCFHFTRCCTGGCEFFFLPPLQDGGH